MRIKQFFNFIQERHGIYQRRAAGYPKPWTTDKILQNYRFCNVYRELDTQTQWLTNNWRTRNNTDKDFWFAALVFRFVNWHETAEELGYPVPFYPQAFTKVLRRRKDRGDKVYSGAYMISTHGVRQAKDLYLANSLSKIWDARDTVRYRDGETLAEFHYRLMSLFDVGSFLAAQVIADAKYAGALKNADDWWTFAASGPGSRRGMNRLFAYDVKQPWKEEKWRSAMNVLYDSIKIRIQDADMPDIHAQDIQNCLCEFDKYERVRLGEGRPKSKYNGV